MTAVEWLGFELNKRFTEIPTDLWEEISSLFTQAKQMEKEQLHKCASFWRGKENEIEKPIFEQYYNETFKSE